MNFQYSYITQNQADLEIDDIGNCAIEALNDAAEAYYLVIKTKYGTTSVVSYGPIIPDVDVFPKSVNCSFKRLDYDEFKVEKIIDEFLNKGFRNISQAREISPDEALSNCRSIIEYMKDPNNY